MRKFRDQPPLARYGTYALMLVGIGCLAYLPMLLDRYYERPAKLPDGTPNPWQIPGYKTGQQARVWVDPETKCHYLITGGSYSWNLVPRYDADGASLICNQPVPQEAQ